MNHRLHKTAVRGFTLIELMVVIAIIGMLSSVVIASLSTARLRARDASIRGEVQQFATLFELQFNTSGSYASLQPGWVYTVADCNAQYGSSNFVTQARAICAKMVSDIGGNGFYSFTTADPAKNWSIMAYLPGANTAYCAGSSGGRSLTPAWGNWTGAGCYTTP